MQTEQSPRWRSVRSHYRPGWRRWLGAVEWATERVVGTLRRWAFIDLLQLVGSFSVVCAAFSYCSGSDARRIAQDDAKKARQYEAWQVIVAAEGTHSNGGRIQALEDLNRDGVDLAGIDVSGAKLRGIDLRGARLRSIQADSTDIGYSDLRVATILGASFRNAYLYKADLRGVRAPSGQFELANLDSACLQGAWLFRTAFRRAQMRGTNFTSSYLAGADLRGAVLSGAKLDSATLRGVDFRGADLTNASFDGASVTFANFDGAVGADIEDLRTRGAVWIESDSAWAVFRLNREDAVYGTGKGGVLHDEMRSLWALAEFLGSARPCYHPLPEGMGLSADWKYDMRGEPQYK